MYLGHSFKHCNLKLANAYTYKYRRMSDAGSGTLSTPLPPPIKKKQREKYVYQEGTAADPEEAVLMSKFQG